jgi:predicted 3-demethylubiquinone-9 3-methyltransferase (glyoxalase superfamily)
MDIYSAWDYCPRVAISGVTTCLWFDHEAQAAADFYVSVFPNSHVLSTSFYPAGSVRPAGEVLTVEFEILGQKFLALNGGPQFPHSQAVSFQVCCDSQEEIDEVWDALTSDGGQESMCSWCIDRFGVSWQVVPRQLVDYLSSGDAGIVARAYAAVMTMSKIDIAAVEAAVEGKPLASS